MREKIADFTNWATIIFVAFVVSLFLFGVLVVMVSIWDYTLTSTIFPLPSNWEGDGYHRLTGFQTVVFAFSFSLVGFISARLGTRKDTASDVIEDLWTGIISVALILAALLPVAAILKLFFF